jgi:predicted ArsR family transcriptional regulator
MGRDLFATLGVPTTVLRRAFGGAPSKRGGEGRTRVSIDVLTSGIAARPKGAKLTVAEISEEIGGSPATVRKVLDQLTKDGVVANEGPDLNYGGRGRAPIVFVRK